MVSSSDGCWEEKEVVDQEGCEHSLAATYSTHWLSRLTPLFYFKLGCQPLTVPLEATYLVEETASSVTYNGLAQFLTHSIYSIKFFFPSFFKPDVQSSMNYFLTLLRSALQLPLGSWLPAWEPVVCLMSTPPNLYTYYFILTGWGCSAIQQLKHNQNSLMLIVHGINEHQWSFQILAQEASESKLLDMLNVQWCQKKILCFFVPGSQVSYTVNLMKKVNLFSFLCFSFHRDSFLNHQEGIKIVVLTQGSNR